MKNSLIILFSICSTFLSAQKWESSLKEITTSPTIAQKYDFFKEYRKTNPYNKGNGYKPYARELNFLLPRCGSDSVLEKNILYLEWLNEDIKRKNHKNTNNSNWIAKGPINTPIILSNGKKRGNGRINCIAFDPIDENVIWVGTPAGGLWKTVNGGNSWTTNTDNLPVIGVSSIAINPINSQEMYIVTGDADASDTYSIGVLKSIDGGNNWNTTGLSYNISQQKRINKIIINPNNTDSVFAVTNTNIMLSVDGGNNWNSVGITGRWRDIEFKPGNPSVIYAVKQTNGGSNVYRSLNGGNTWSVINNGIATSGKDRPLIAVTASNPEVIYVLFSATDDSFHGLYKSIDSGNNWTLQSNSPNILGRHVDGTSTGGQSWYDLTLGVAPNNENIVYVGGINLWKSNDSGINWSIEASSGNDQQLYSYMHVDHHAFEFNPLNNIAYAGNDGGIYKYLANLSNWIDISDGLEISQFYKLGLSLSNENRLVAGAQDNGTEMLTNSTWDAIRGSDGMECAIDPFDEDVIYSSSQYGGLKKTYDGGNYWTNIKPVSYEGAWVTPYKIHPNNNNLIVAGYDEVYRSLTAGSSWDSVSYNVSGGQALRTIALAPSNEDYIYAASYSTLKVTTDAGVSWENIKPGLPNYSITDIVVSNTNPDHIWVTFSGYSSGHKVYESKDRGLSWINITGSNLPNLPVNCIVYQNSTNDALYIGTDIGIYYKNNYTGDWSSYMNGLPNVIISELEIHYTKGTISAATYGRGVWESPLNYFPSSTNENEEPSFSFFPNPSKNNIYISHNFNPKSKIKIYTLAGQLVFEKNLNTNKIHEVNTSIFSDGCYLIELCNSDGFKSYKKLVIK